VPIASSASRETCFMKHLIRTLMIWLMCAGFAWRSSAADGDQNGVTIMRFETDGIRFAPCLPPTISSVELQNVHYRKMTLNVAVRGVGTKIKQCLINGRESNDRFVAATGMGRQQITIILQK
jgi:hypothetical protein